LTEFDPSRPLDKSEIIAVWHQVSDQVAATFSGYSAEEFPEQRNGWSYAQNLDHLITSATAVSNALKLPKLLLRLLFGTGSASRTSGEVKSAYLAKLEQGSQASGKFVPTGSGSQREMLAEWKSTSDDLITNLDRWNEQQLDRMRLPHPLIGKLTVREMLYFTIFHTRHHLDNCNRKEQGT
jgi:uncharacterized damage-inducible protein DinB